MTPEETRGKIMNRLLLNEEDTLDRLRNTVDKAERLFKFDVKSQSVVLSDFSMKTLSMKEKICAYLVAKYIGATLLEIKNGKHFFESDSASLADIASFFGKKITDISGRFTELVKDKLVDRNEAGEYRIHHHKIEAVLETLTSKSVRKSR